MNFPIPPRPIPAARLRSDPPTVDGRPRSTWGWFEGVGVYLLATIAGGFASLPVLSALGDTSVNGAVGHSEILATIVADVVITAVLVFWLARWHREWRSAMVLPPDRTGWRHLIYGGIAGLILVPAVGLISGGIEAVFREAVGHRSSFPNRWRRDCRAWPLALSSCWRRSSPPSVRSSSSAGCCSERSATATGSGRRRSRRRSPSASCTTYPSPAIDALVLQLTMVFTGIGLAWIYERRGTIVASMAAHMAFNVVGLVVILGILR